MRVAFFVDSLNGIGRQLAGETADQDGALAVGTVKIVTLVILAVLQDEKGIAVQLFLRDADNVRGQVLDAFILGMHVHGFILAITYV
jgi:hypothetical protein